MKEMKFRNTNFLIIGSGIAGLYTALKLSALGKVTILTKEKLQDSNTQYAQGGIAAVLDKGDSWELHLKDTLEAGAGLCDEKAVKVLVKEGPERVKELIKIGTQFDHIEGELDLTREGAHSKRRILHARGDATGVEIRESLTNAINNNKNIELEENTFMVDFILSQEHVVGVTAENKGKYISYLASAVIAASGGCSQVYVNTSNPDVTTGDGIAAAYRAGAVIKDMEFIQFHPTTLFNPDGSSFLISESVRGEGGVLLNKSGERFMLEYHPQAELAPRDVVARAIVKEADKDNNPFVYLDVTHFDPDFVVNRFPTIFKTLMENGYDMRNELIPVVPAAHYLMGGIKTNSLGQTNLSGLYACGEVACTGVHGANRLASNSLLEGLVFGHRIFETIKKRGKDYRLDLKEGQLEVPVQKSTGRTEVNLKKLKKKFRQKMTEMAGIERDRQGLVNLIEWIKSNIIRLVNTRYTNQELWELYNMMINGKLIALAALKRKESRGGHYRLEYPESRSEWLHTHIIFDKKNPEGKKYVR
ncbi:MAG: L-aspartate oxidase [Halothermotrichaceae bacterium]